MKKLLAALGTFTLLPAIVLANEEKITKGFYTNDAMGCMLLLECTRDVEQVWGIDQLKKVYPDSDWDSVAVEFSRILNALTLVEVKVFLADERYFPVGHRGVYHTVGNNFFLNKTHMRRPGVLMSVMRHEGWHAAQDCMAGSIKNSLIAIIKPEEDVPEIWRTMAERTYPKASVPWEAEASWAGRTEGMTMKALEACANGKMWEVYEPTPLTKQWLVDEGYIKEK